MSSSRAAWVELLCTVVVPTVVLLLGADLFGPVGVLVAGLAAPAGWAAYLLAREGRGSPMAVLSLMGVGASGTIGLLELDSRWFAWKEASLGGLVGLATLASAFSPWPMVRLLLDRLFVPERLKGALDRVDGHRAYDRAVRFATGQLAALSLLASVGSGVLASQIVRSPTGTAEFAQELGDYTGWSFPVVTIPAMVLSVVVLRRLLAQVEQLVGEPWDELLPPLEG